MWKWEEGERRKWRCGERRNLSGRWRERSGNMVLLKALLWVVRFLRFAGTHRRCMRKCRGVLRGNRDLFSCSECLVLRVWWWDGRVKLNHHWAWWCL